MACVCQSWCLRPRSAITSHCGCPEEADPGPGLEMKPCPPFQAEPQEAGSPTRPCEHTPAPVLLGSGPEGKMHGPLGLLCPQSSILPDNQFFLCPKSPWEKSKLAGSTSREDRNQQVIAREHHSSSPKFPNRTALSVTGVPGGYPHRRG